MENIFIKLGAAVVGGGMLGNTMGSFVAKDRRIVDELHIHSESYSAKFVQPTVRLNSTASANSNMTKIGFSRWFFDSDQ